MKRTPLIILTVSLTAMAIGFVADAGDTSRWTQGGREEFLKGDPKSASINSEGGIMLPPVATKLFETPQQFVWDIAVDPLGRLYVSGGNDGVIYDANGNPVHNDSKPEVHALAVGPDGRIYFGTSPNGGVFRLGPDGKAEEFYVPDPDGTGRPERYIWDMAFDGAGNLYVATGIEGRLYKVDRNGSGKVVFDSDEGHITCVAVGRQGLMIFGSDPNGQIFQMDAGGKVFVLFDSPLKEISSLAVAPDGTIYAAGIAENALKKQAEETEKSESDKSTVSETVKTASVTVSNSGDGTTSDGEVSAIYRIHTDNTVDSIWSSKNHVVYSLAIDRGGRAVFGTGPKGLLIAVNPDGTETVLRRLEGMQVTALQSVRGELFAGVSNLGKAYKLTERFANRGEFISQVKDTVTVSTFGTIRWTAELPAGTSMALSTRTGNTEEPDNTWSDWSEAYGDPRGSKIVSPAARYIQWRAELSTTEPSSTPLLKSVSVYYLQNNLKPRIKSAVILPVGITFKPGIDDLEDAEVPAEIMAELVELNLSSGVSSSMGKPIFRRPMRTIRWTAADANSDELVFRLLYRPLAGGEWTPLAEKIKESYFSIDTRSLADGTYVVRIEASDTPSNTPERALMGSLDTQPFDVDNTPPRVEGLMATASGSGVTISFLAADDMSAIKDLRVRIDAGEWQVVLPRDGIADSRQEQVEVRLNDLSAGDHVVSVRVLDELFNVGAGRAAFKVR
jgi:streptogramin lyase